MEEKPYDNINQACTFSVPTTGKPVPINDLIISHKKQMAVNAGQPSRMDAKTHVLQTQS